MLYVCYPRPVRSMLRGAGLFKYIHMLYMGNYEVNFELEILIYRRKRHFSRGFVLEPIKGIVSQMILSNKNGWFYPN
jgi:hypothetical protein